MIQSIAAGMDNEVATGSCPSGKVTAATAPSSNAVVPPSPSPPQSPRSVKWARPISTTFPDIPQDDALPEYNEYHPERSSGSVRFRTIPQVFTYHPADPIVRTRDGCCCNNNRWSDHRNGTSTGGGSGGGDVSPQQPHRQGSFSRPNVAVAARPLLDNTLALVVILGQLECSA
jgi:hypothetical protein